MSQKPKYLYPIAGFMCLVCTGGYVFQLATDSVCFTKLAFTYVGNSAFWLWAYYFLIANQGSTQLFDTRWLLKHVIVSTLLVLTNQLVVYGFVEGSFQLIFSCSSEYGVWGELQVNNFILHGSLYFLLIGLDQYFKRKASVDQPSKHSNVIHVRQNGKINRLNLSDIVYLEASNNAVFVHTKKHKYFVFQSLKSLLEEIDNAGFKRVHRTYAVNEDFILSFSPKPSGDGTLHLQNDISLRVSRNYKHTLQLNSLNLH